MVSTKIIIVIVGICLLVGISGEILLGFDIREFGEITQTAGIVGKIGGLILLLAYGTLIKSKPFFQLILASFALIAVGAIIKILHLPLADIVLLTGLLVIPVIYSMHFFKKPNKHRLDILKLIWVIVSYTAVIFNLQNFSFEHEYETIERLLFVILFAEFAYRQYQIGKHQTITN